MQALDFSLESLVARLRPAHLDLDIAQLIFARPQLSLEQVAVAVVATGQGQEKQPNRERRTHRQNSSPAPSLATTPVSAWEGPAGAPARGPRFRIPWLPWPT